MDSSLIATADDRLAARMEATLSIEWSDGQFTRARDQRELLRLAKEREPALILVDLRRPSPAAGGGLGKLRQVSRALVIALVADAAALDLVDDGEVDEYLVLPFSPVELVARIKAAFQRLPGAKGRSTHHALVSENAPPARFEDGYLSLDFAQQRFRAGEKWVYLTEVELALLTELVRSIGRVVPERCLLAKLWGCATEDTSECLAVYLRRLRQKLEPHADCPQYLLTERGLGYRFARSAPRPVSAKPFAWPSPLRLVSA